MTSCSLRTWHQSGFGAFKTTYLTSERKLTETIFWHLCTCSAAALLFDLFAKHPTCCCGPPLWGLGDVRRPGFVGHSDDSKHLAVRLLSAHQNKHRRFCSSTPPPHPQHSPSSSDWVWLNDKTLRMHRTLPSLIQAMLGSKVELGDHSPLLSRQHCSRECGCFPSLDSCFSTSFFSFPSILLATLFRQAGLFPL